MPDTEKPNAGTGLVQIGSYRLAQQLGTGGMSSVFRAVHVETGHEVALKVLPRTLAKNATLLQRFLREAKSVEGLEHPNIVAIFDRGTEQGRYYLVLEYVPGGDLHDRVRNGGPLPAAEAVGLVRGVAEGLKYAAAQGLIHRDIKPANILLGTDGQPKVADLGLAVQIDEEDERVTRDGTTVGTVDYMAPEQARDSRATSVRSDIYSLGCTFYHLLAGAPPFAGGDVTDKLRRHAFEPAPDVRRARPDLPEALSALVSKMMAKKPDARFKDYDELIAALDALALPESAAAPGPLYALLDDDDEAEGIAPDIAGPKPVVPAGSTAEANVLARPPAAKPAARPAEKKAAPPPSRPDLPRKPAAHEISMAELAAIDDEEPAARPGRARRPSEVAPPPLRPAGVAAIDDGLIPLAGASNAMPRRADDGSLRDWILRGVMIGVAVVVVGFGLSQLVLLLTAPEGPGPEAEQAATEESAEENEPSYVAPLPKPKAEPPKPAPESVAWTEPPGSAPREAPPEPPVPAAAESACLPDWARAEPFIDGPTVTIRRVVGGDRPRDVVPSLARALDTIGGTAEFADDGPFFEPVPRPGTRPKRIRSKPGYRATVVVEPPALDPKSTRTSVLVVDGQDLVLEGLDIVVPVGDMPAHVTAFVQCRSGSLTLRDCTLTLAGPPERPFTAFRLGDPGQPTPGELPRLRLERTLVRGPAATAIQFAEGAGRAWLSRSVALCGNAPAVVVSRTSGPVAPRSRELVLLRSVLAGRRSIIDDALAASAAAGAPALVVRSAGSTMARTQGGGPCPLIVTRGGSPKALLDWSGDADTFAGWSSWMSPVGNAADPSGTVADLSAARGLWGGAEESGHESAEPWPDPHPREWTRGDVEARTPAAAATASRVAWPAPRVVPGTVGTFPRLETLSAAPTPDRSLAFDAGDPRWGGDLGRFVASQDLSGVKSLAVEVRGHGAHPLTPILMPDGVGLAVTVVPASPPLTWTSTPGPYTAALFEVRGATLSLTGVRVPDRGERDHADLVRVTDGDLRLLRCVLVHQQALSHPEGALVRFAAPSSRPLGLEAGEGRPAVAPTRLPTALLTDCVLIGHERALAAQVGCGVVALRNCAVAAETAFELLPASVAADRFAAGLQLDRCTVAAGRTFVKCGPWPGSPEGPARPWVVSTAGTAFLDAFDHGTGLARERSVVLRIDPEAMARGALTWQGAGDVYDVVAFLAAVGAPPPSSPRPDVQREWVDLWGRAHIGRVGGPVRGTPWSGVRVHPDKLKFGQVKPGDLALESTGPSKGRIPEVGADLRFLTETPPPPPPPPAATIPNLNSVGPAKARIQEKPRIQTKKAQTKKKAPAVTPF